MPIDVGGRLTGRVGRYSVGAAQHPDRRRRADRAARRRPTSPCVRVKRDILRRSSIGADRHRPIGRRRAAPAANQAYGVDGTFALLRQPDDQHLLGADRHRRACAGDDTSYRAQLDYAGDRYGVQLERLVDRRRTSTRRSASCGATTCAATSASSASARGRARARLVRKYRWIGVAGLHRERRRPARDARRATASSASSSRTATAFSVGYSDTYEFLPRAVRDRAGVTLPVGGYDFGSRARSATTWASSGGCRRNVYARATARSTTATRRRSSISRGRVNLSPPALDRADLLGQPGRPRSRGRSRRTWPARASPTR